MTLRQRILAFGLVSLLSIMLLAGIALLSLQFSGQFVQRIDGVQRRLEVLAELDRLTHDYGQRAAASLAGNSDAQDALGTARIEIERAFARLAVVTRNEISRLPNVSDVERELPELESARRMTELFRSIDAAMARALLHRREGRGPEARAVFERDVEFRLDNELQTLLADALAGEHEEVGEELLEAESLQSRLLTGAMTVAAAGVLLLLLLGWLLWRGIVVPLRALALSQQALAAGESGHRLPAEGDGELGTVARSFNRMAKAVEDQRRQLGEAQERLTAEAESRTHDLEEANSRLRSIDARRVQFLADVSHQLRTPLTILRGEADVALRSADPEAQRNALERIQAQAIEFGDLLDDLMLFARSDAEGQEHEPTPMRVADLVAGAAKEGESLAETREIVISLDLRDRGARILADGRLLKQALLVGIDNAVKHSPPGSTIEVGTELGESHVIIHIRDEGEGVDEADQPRVFERFFRGAEGSRQSPGLGIGLAIAKEIVERHGGEIALRNRSEGGADLAITLPLTAEETT